jgi:hypothetical protein
VVRAAVTAALLGTAGPLAACTWSTGLEAGVQDSRWRETDDQGRTLLHERGTLAATQLAVEARDCRLGEASARLSLAGGSRRYDGRTSAGNALTTRSDVREQGLTLQVLPWAWGAPGSGATVHAGARLRWQRSERDIRSTATALGYPERHQRLQAALVLGAHGSGPASGWHWRAELAAGGGPAGRMEVSLPGYDPATLKLGSSRLLMARLHIGGALAPGWSWQLAVEHDRERRSAGEPTALRRQGQVVGGVLQPASREAATRLVAGLIWQLGR